MNDCLMQDLKKNLKCLEAAGCLFKTEFYQYYFFFYIHKTFPISLMCHVLKTLGFLCNSISVHPTDLIWFLNNNVVYFVYFVT